MNDRAHDAWIATSAAALCRGARWPLALSLGLTLLAAQRLLGGQHGIVPVVVVAAGVAQAYLALRIELDRHIFDRLAADPAGAADFDAALGKAGLGGAQPTPRAMAGRARGLKRLVMLAGALLILQAAAMAAGRVLT